MYRATTPRLTFSIRSDYLDPTKHINIDDFLEFRVSIYQEPQLKMIKSIRYTPDNEWVTEDEGISIDEIEDKIVVELTEDEMNRFRYGDAFCQVRVLTGRQKVFASKVFKFVVGYVLDDVEMGGDING